MDDLLEKKNLWMNEKEIQKEKEVLDIINRKDLTCTEKAKALGYKRKTVYVDNIKKTGWVNYESLYLRVRELIQSKKRMPLGFDFYYWGLERYKQSLREKKDSEQYLKLFPNDCANCLGRGWRNNQQCDKCK